MSFVVDQQARLSGFGIPQVVEDTPVSQVEAVYGLRDDLFTTSLAGAAVDAADGMFELSSGTNSVSLATGTTDRPITYRPGQAICGRLTTIFADPLANLDQVAGFINTEAVAAFGYNGTSFGILQARGGLAENQTLQVTTSAGGSENATVTVNGTGYTVALTSGTVEHNAFEITVSLNSQVPNYAFSSNGDTVEAAADIPTTVGSFAFSSATAVASWTQVTTGQGQTDTWISQGAWNGENVPDFDPENLNTFEIVYDGNIQFYIQVEDGEFILVHTIEWANNQTEPYMRNPSQRIGWAIRNVGNTTDRVMKGGYCASFIQGEVRFDEPPRGDCVTEVNIGTAEETILVLRNRLIYDGIPNRAFVRMLNLQASSDTNRALILKAYTNPEFDLTTGDLIFDYEDQASSVIEVAKDNISLAASQKPILCYVVQGNTELNVDLTNLDFLLLGRDVLVFTAEISAGSASAVNLSVNWEEGL